MLALCAHGPGPLDLYLPVPKGDHASRLGGESACEHQEKGECSQAAPEPGEASRLVDLPLKLTIHEELEGVLDLLLLLLNDFVGLVGATARRDVVQLIEKSIEAPDDLRFDIFYGVSNNRFRWVDIDHAREILGYIPQDSAEEVLERG